MPTDPPPPRHRGVDAVARWALAVAAVPLLATFGDRHWLLDLLAHFPHHCLLVLTAALCVLLPCRRWWSALLLLPSFALLIAQLLPLLPWPAPPPTPSTAPVRAVAANLSYQNGDPLRLQPQVDAFAPDLLALTEFTVESRTALEPLRARYPHRVEAPQAGAFGIALWSRWPLRSARTVPLGGDRFLVIAAVADTDAGPLGIVVAHPPPPGGAVLADARDRALADLPPLLATLPAARVLLGDLNATRFCAPFRALVAATGLRDSCEGRGLQTSWPAALPRWLGIAIDHVLVSPAVDVVDRRVGAAFGSDHLPVFATLALRR